MVRMHLAPVLGLRIKVLQGGDPTHMLNYQLEGDEASISLLNRLAAPGEDATTVLGTLAPMTPVTLSADAKVAACIPAAARRFAFAYPLADSLDADTEALLQMVIGSVSRLDDELFFFLLLGGFCYFDGDGGFLQANAISLKHDAAGELHFDGPYCCDSEAAEELSESYVAEHLLSTRAQRSCSEEGMLLRAARRRVGQATPTHTPRPPIPSGSQ